MAKPTPDRREDAGERLLRDWGIGDDPPPQALAALLGQDAAADVAIAHRLGGIASDESAGLLQRIEATGADKRVRKEAKRSLYRLGQRGIRPPSAAPAPAPPTPAVGPALEGYVSPVDGRGDQLVWLLKPQPGGVAHLFAVINDPEGLHETALSSVTRKQLKALQAELERKHELRLVPIDWHYADFLMQRAFGWARARGTRMDGDYPALRNQLIRVPAPGDLPPCVLAHVDAAAIGEPQLAASAELLEEPELRTWFLGPEQVRPFLDELAAARDSPLVLNQVQEQERFDAVIARAIDTTFAPDSRPSWSRRLYELGFFFAVTRRRAHAEQAVAVAQALARDGLARDIPFCAFLVRASLAVFFRAAVEQEQEQQKTSLVLTPHQAVRQREGR
jgi:hypothetical protein